MAEAARQRDMLGASAANTANVEKPTNPESSTHNSPASDNTHSVADLPESPASQHLVTAHSLIHINEGDTGDIHNDLAIAHCKHIFAVYSNPDKVQNIFTDQPTPHPTSTMAGRFPVLNTSDLPQASASEMSATASPARGSAMLNSIFKSVRVPEFRFRWMFWAEKGQQGGAKDKTAQPEEYASRPKPLGEQIISIKEFYQHFNNIPVESLKLRDSIHLFHMGIKPVWEDPRNTRGGAWYFKVTKDMAPQFWHELCLLAVGDVLQGAVETKRACEYRI